MVDEAANEKVLEDRVEIPADAAELAHRIVEIASDKKGNDIVMLRTAELTTMAPELRLLASWAAAAPTLNRVERITPRANWPKWPSVLS